MVLVVPALGLEFKDNRVEDFFTGALFWGIPLIVFFAVGSTVSKQDGFLEIMLKLGLTIAAVVVVFFFSVLTAFSNMCDYSTAETLFIHKKDPSLKIVVRYFGCGATDSTPATPHVQKMKPLAGIFLKFESIDTTQLDKTEWLAIEEE